MEPYLRDGDHVLTFNWVKVKAEDVVVFKIAEGYFVKRVEQVSGEHIVVEGDNRALSSKMEPIKAEQVVGKVVLKY